MNGVINLLKPPGMTSSQAVSFIKRLSGERTGHCGTLDPEASGVLPIMLGKATKLFDYMTEKDKVYVAEVTFGASTDTQDATGQILSRSGSCPDAAAIQHALTRLLQRDSQTPPVYSALKRGGKAAYELARAGIEVRMDERPVSIHTMDYVAMSGKNRHLIRVNCGKGTYIRTICKDLGDLLYCPAHMSLLVREQSGMFHIRNAVTVEELKERTLSPESLGVAFTSMDEALKYLPKAEADTRYFAALSNGVSLPASECKGCAEAANGGLFRLWCGQRLFGVYAYSDGFLRLKTMLVERDETERNP